MIRGTFYLNSKIERMNIKWYSGLWKLKYESSIQKAKISIFYVLPQQNATQDRDGVYQITGYRCDNITVPLPTISMIQFSYAGEEDQNTVEADEEKSNNRINKN